MNPSFLTGTSKNTPASYRVEAQLSPTTNSTSSDTTSSTLVKEGKQIFYIQCTQKHKHRWSIFCTYIHIFSVPNSQNSTTIFLNFLTAYEEDQT